MGVQKMDDREIRKTIEEYANRIQLLENHIKQMNVVLKDILDDHMAFTSQCFYAQFITTHKQPKNIMIKNNFHAIADEMSNNQNTPAIHDIHYHMLDKMLEAEYIKTTVVLIKPELIKEINKILKTKI
jgi:hypothetical protein